MNDPLYNQMRELSWRRKLSAEEDAALRAWLEAHPEAQAEWKAEAALSDALNRLPDVPVPSNFTARVFHAIEQDAAAEDRHRARKWQFWRRLHWLPKAALATVVIGAGLISYHQVQLSHDRERAQALVAVSRGVSSLPNPEVLKDFDAIQASSQTPADEALLAALTVK